ncbi:MAG: F0F1 ATP synthase subunit A [Cytophagales bacterium]|nr:F0F1 ATP synthase subunit A [Bernardetiaceae bacterium]MDW8204589.1 F0F1 ATP synthase subunit A [Cytophagales bacterium]
MCKTLRNLLIASCLIAYTSTVFAKGEHQDTDAFSPKDMILHHIGDAYDWHFFDYKKSDGTVVHVSLPLPVILITEGHVDVFLSSEFHHGEQQVVRGDRVYRLEHGHIREANGKKVIDLSFTKNVASMFVACIILVSIFISVAKAYEKRPGQAPSGLQAFIEPIVLFVRDDVIIPNIGEKKYKTYLPYLMTLFFFIWVNNLLGLIPTGANASGNIAFTLTLAAFTAIITNVSGNKDYWKHIFAMPGVPKLMLIIMIPVELIGILTKPFALMIRLFANITAGHIVILCLVSFIFIFKNALLGLPVGFVVVAITFLELFVAALQAYIFTLLSALFIGLAVEEHEHHHEAAHH